MTAASPPAETAPWLRIWTHPRVTLRQLVDERPRLIEWGLIALSGFAQSLLQAQSNSLGARAPVLMILAVAAGVGTLWGLLQVHVLTLALFTVGRLTHSPATFRQLRTVVAWAAVPHSLLVALWLIGAIALGRVLFINVEALGGAPPLPVLLGMLLIIIISLVTVVWSLVILVAGVAEAQRISIGRAVVTMVGAGLLVGVVALVVLTLFMAISR